MCVSGMPGGEIKRRGQFDRMFALNKVIVAAAEVQSFDGTSMIDPTFRAVRCSPGALSAAPHPTSAMPNRWETRERIVEF